MFIIERRAGDQVRIGEEIRLQVIDTDGDTVRLGIEAPRDVTIERIGNAKADAPSGHENGQTGNARAESRPAGNKSLPGGNEPV